MAVAQGPHPAQHLVVMQQHAARPLDPRLHQHAGDLMALLGQQPLQGGLGRIVPGQGDDVLGRHDAGEQAVHPLFGVTDRHRRQGVAMIAAQEAHEPRAA